MAFIYGDPNPAGPFATFQVKNVTAIAVKLLNTNFTTAGVNQLVARLPGDASILSVHYWNKTKLAGGSVATATMSLGSTSGGTEFVNAFDILTPATGAYGIVTPITGILQPYSIPVTGDIPLYVNGTTTTGNPTSGEVYLLITIAR